MKRLVLVIAACGKSAAPAGPPPAAAPLIEQMKDFADRCDACKAERDCLHAVRDDFDQAKAALLANGARLAGDDKAAFDAQVMRVRVCGDGGGLTFWIDP